MTVRILLASGQVHAVEGASEEDWEVIRSAMLSPADKRWLDLKVGGASVVIRRSRVDAFWCEP